MEEGNDNRKEFKKRKRDEVHSNVVRAGKRTYFIDVKATRKSEHYLTITESKRKFNRNGRFYFEKHKIFLYEEDIDNFIDGLQEMIDFVKENNARLTLDREDYHTDREEIMYQNDENEAASVSDDFTNVEFDDLNK